MARPICPGQNSSPVSGFIPVRRQRLLHARGSDIGVLLADALPILPFGLTLMLADVVLMREEGKKLPIGDLDTPGISGEVLLKATMKPQRDWQPTLHEVLSVATLQPADGSASQKLLAARVTAISSDEIVIAGMERSPVSGVQQPQTWHCRLRERIKRAVGRQK